MTRNSLHQKIQCVHQDLNLRQATFRLTNVRAKVTLMAINPYLIIAAGLLAGGAVSAVGLHKIYNSAMIFYPLLIPRSSDK